MGSGGKDNENQSVGVFKSCNVKKPDIFGLFWWFPLKKIWYIFLRLYSCLSKKSKKAKNPDGQEHFLSCCLGLDAEPCKALWAGGFKEEKAFPDLWSDRSHCEVYLVVTLVKGDPQTINLYYNTFVFLCNKQGEIFAVDDDFL